MSLRENNNRKFDLKVGDKIRAVGPMTAWESNVEYRKHLYIVTKIYPHIFLAVNPVAEKTVAEQSFRKCDYVCGVIERA